MQSATFLEILTLQQQVSPFLELRVSRINTRRVLY